MGCVLPHVLSSVVVQTDAFGEIRINVFKTVLIFACLFAAIWILFRTGNSRGLTSTSIDNAREADRPCGLGAWGVGALFAAFMVYLRQRQYFELQTGWDMAVEANVAWHMVHGPWFYNALDNRSFLGGHFSPIFILLGVVYAISEHPLTLLVIQSAALGLGAVALYWLAFKNSGSNYFAFGAVFFYMVNPYLHYSNAHDFHLSTLAIPAVLWLLVFLEYKNLWMASIVASLVLSIEESVVLPLVGLGLYLAMFRPGLRLFGTVVTLVSAGYFVVIVKVLFPMFNPEPNLFFWNRYGNMGENLEDAFINILSNPIWAFQAIILEDNKFIYILSFLAPVIFLPLFAWREAMLLVIPIMIMQASQYDGQYKLGFHYSAPALPYLFYSSISGYAYVKDRIRPWIHTGHWRHRAVLAGIMVLAAINAYRCPGYDLDKTDDAFVAAAFTLAEHIPPDASVATEVRLAPLVINRHHICKITLSSMALCDWDIERIGGHVSTSVSKAIAPPGWVPEYVLLGAGPRSSDQELKEKNEYIHWLREQKGYHMIASHHGVWLLGRSDPIERS